MSYVLFLDYFHGKNLSSVLLLNHDNFAKSPYAYHLQHEKIVNIDLFGLVFRIIQGRKC